MRKPNHKSALYGDPWEGGTVKEFTANNGLGSQYLTQGQTLSQAEVCHMLELATRWLAANGQPTIYLEVVQRQLKSGVLIETETETETEAETSGGKCWLLFIFI